MGFCTEEEWHSPSLTDLKNSITDVDGEICVELGYALGLKRRTVHFTEAQREHCIL